MKRWTTLIMAAALIMALFMLTGSKAGMGGQVSGAESDLYQVNETTEHSEEWYLKQVESNLAYNAIINAFSERKGPAPDDGKFHQCTDGDLYSTDIPDYYGGSYLNTEADLVVLIKESSGEECIAEGKKFIESVCGSASIIFRNVRFSYAELLDGMSDLYNYCQSDQHKEDTFSIFSFCILQNQNKISIYTDTVDEKDIKRVRQAVRIPEALEFVYNDTGLSTTASANCGTVIGTSPSTMSISIGYPAKYTSNGSSITGFVTCGHWFTSSTPSGVYCPSGYLGAVDPNKKMIYGSVDGAFVQLQFGSQINHYIGSTGLPLSSTVILYINEGNTASMCGMSGNTSGTVKSTNSDGYYSDIGVIVSGMVETDYTSQNGDSGGLVYLNAVNIGYAVGIQSGHYYYFGACRSLYSKAQNINTALGITIN